MQHFINYLYKPVIMGAVSMFSLCMWPMKVFDGWVMKGETFPSSQDHPLPLNERYVDYCDSSSARTAVRSSQNVAMVFFRIHNPGSSFTLTVRKHVNPFREYTANNTQEQVLICRFRC